MSKLTEIQAKGRGLRPYQEVKIDQLVKQKNGKSVVQIPTGMGKSGAIGKTASTKK